MHGKQPIMKLLTIVFCRYNGTGSDPWGTAGDPWGGGDTHGPGTTHRMNADEIRAQQQAMIKGELLVLDPRLSI